VRKASTRPPAQRLCAELSVVEITGTCAPARITTRRQAGHEDSCLDSGDASAARREPGPSPDAELCFSWGFNQIASSALPDIRDAAG